ncbi:MAG: hypothetical protein ACTTJS_06350 [Wolinella sp.]
MKTLLSLPLSLLLATTPIFAAKAHLLSPLPLPHQEIVNIDPKPCDEACLAQLFDEGKVFSFVARFPKELESEELRAKLSMFANELGIHLAPFEFRKSRSRLNLALIIPKKSVGRYSVTTIDTILAYLASKEGAFKFAVFDSVDESRESLFRALESVKDGGFENVIALLTHDGARELVAIPSTLQIYIPTIHKSQLETLLLPQNITFGGIDYKAQIDALVSFADGKGAVVYNDDSPTGARIGAYVRNSGLPILFEESFSNAKAAEFNKGSKAHGQYVSGASVFLNTSIVKSSLILSQFTYNGYIPKNIFSTQINYNHSILSLTQPRDRKNLYIASSLGDISREIIEYSAILKSDLQYDWINYSTSRGVEFFYQGAFADAVPYFSEGISDQQVEYKTRIYKSEAGRFRAIENQ